MYKNFKDKFCLLDFVGEIDGEKFDSKSVIDKKISIIKKNELKTIFVNIRINSNFCFIIKINTININVLKIFILNIIVNILQFFLKILSYFIRDISVIKLMGIVINMKYKIMEKHTEKAVFYCKELLQNIDMKKYNIYNIYKFKREMIDACYIHDIGKIGIEDKILNKIETLTESEWDIIKRHPQIGFEIISKINLFEYLPNVILYHHERYDGTGYPKKLIGEEIPIEARIFSVIDAFDAMISDRGYKDSLTKEEAIKELKKEKSKQFDPVIVDIFCNCLEKEIYER